jgi:hypothetical protein
MPVPIVPLPHTSFIKHLHLFVHVEKNRGTVKLLVKNKIKIHQAAYSSLLVGNQTGPSTVTGNLTLLKSYDFRTNFKESGR